MWWFGLISMGLGEAANFIAYAFAPATLVTPLGALSVLVSAVLSSYFLRETLNIIGKVGCLMCILGSVIIVLHAPSGEEVVYDMDILEKMLIEPGFLIYAIAVVIAALILMYYFGPRYGNTNMLIYIAICSVIGSLSVMCCKGIGIAIMQTATGINQFDHWLTWFCIIALIITVSVHMNYLNKALDIYNTSVVTPIYYVFFTSSVLIASAILFKEWNDMGGSNMVGVFTGFAIIICAIFLLNVFKDHDLTLTTVREYINNAAPSQSSMVPNEDSIAYFNPESSTSSKSSVKVPRKTDYEQISEENVEFLKTRPDHFKRKQ